MNNYRKFDEDAQIIGTPRYKYFQRMCNEAGLFAIKEARDKGLPITYVENCQIVKEYIDGRKEILGTVKPRVKVEQKIIKLK